MHDDAEQCQDGLGLACSWWALLAQTAVSINSTICTARASTHEAGRSAASDWPTCVAGLDALLCCNSIVSDGKERSS